MKTPDFWGTRNLFAVSALPLSLLYTAIFRLRWALSKPQKINVPVLCVGGLTAGGAGKTPVCLHIGELCRQQGINAWFLTRGYKGKLRGPVQVKPSEHTAYDVGDEPLLLSRVLPTVVAKDRVLGAKYAAKAGAQLIIMDDGFQNPTIHKDVSISVIDGKHRLGNGFVIPAGPLRESAASGLRRADGVVLINPTAPLTLPTHALQVMPAHTKPGGEALALAGKKVFAFCGLAYPQKFFSTLSALGAQLVEQETFPDHYQYTDAEIDALALAAKKHDAILVTTSKDAARMNVRSLSLVRVVYVTLEFEQPAALLALIDKALAAA